MLNKQFFHILYFMILALIIFACSKQNKQSYLENKLNPDVANFYPVLRNLNFKRTGTKITEQCKYTLSLESGTQVSMNVSASIETDLENNFHGKKEMHFSTDTIMDGADSMEVIYKNTRLFVKSQKEPFIIRDNFNNDAQNYAYNILSLIPDILVVYESYIKIERTQNILKISLNKDVPKQELPTVLNDEHPQKYWDYFATPTLIKGQFHFSEKPVFPESGELTIKSLLNKTNFTITCTWSSEKSNKIVIKKPDYVTVKQSSFYEKVMNIVDKFKNKN